MLKHSPDKTKVILVFSLLAINMDF